MTTPQAAFCALTRPQVLAALESRDDAVAREVERLIQGYAALFADTARPTGPIPPSVAVPLPESAIALVALETANARLRDAQNALCRQ